MAQHAPQHLAPRPLLRRILSLVGIDAVSVAAGLCAAYLSLAFLGGQGFKVSGSDAIDLYLGVVGACVLVGLLYWRGWASQSPPLTVGKGTLLGLLCSALAHPIMWFIAFLIHNQTADPSTFLGLSWNFQAPTPLGEIIETGFVVVYGLIYVGWITSLVGGAVGAGLALLRRGSE